MNFHILLVHFPIALLTVYAALELLQLVWFRQWEGMSHAKRAMLWIGAAAIIPTLVAGWVIHEPYERALSELLGAHMLFASLTAIIFIYLALCYAVVAVRRNYKDTLQRLCAGMPALCTVVHIIADASLGRFVVQCIAAAGFVCLLITGALGGALAHGRDVDPIVTIIYNLIVR